MIKITIKKIDMNKTKIYFYFYHIKNGLLFNIIKICYFSLIEFIDYIYNNLLFILLEKNINK